MAINEFVTTVVVKAAQRQLCYSNLVKGAIEKKSNVRKEISEVAQKILEVDIQGETLSTLVITWFVGLLQINCLRKI